MSLKSLMIAGLVVVSVAAWRLTLTRQSPSDKPAVPLRIRTAVANTAAKNAATNTAASPVAPPPLIRVGLNPDPVKSVTIEVSGPFRIQTIGSSRLLQESARLSAAKVTVSPKGLRIGTQEFRVPQLEIVPQASPAVWIDGHQYRGMVRVYRKPGETVAAVNVLPLEDYVACVVDSEMPAAFSTEARMAQAIVARTYALYQKQAATPDSLTDVFASTRSQKYLGFQYRSEGGRLLAGESQESRRIAAETRGMVCTWQGQLFCTYYCAACGGATLLGTEFFPDAAPPLQSVPCNWCQPAPLYRWSADIARTDLQTDLQKFISQRDGVALGRIKSLKAAGTPRLGRLPVFEVRDDKRPLRLSGADLRRASGVRGLNSPQFTIEDKGARFSMNGRGFGHGVGLCQWGARGLAMAGKSRYEILNYYYPGSKVVIINSPDKTSGQASRAASAVGPSLQKTGRDVRRPGS